LLGLGKGCGSIGSEQKVELINTLGAVHPRHAEDVQFEQLCATFEHELQIVPDK